MELVKDIYDITKKFPKEELYGLTSQMRRSAISIPSNIAEGFARRVGKEYPHFILIALGPCSELETQVELSYNIRYIGMNEFHELSEKIIIIAKMLNKLYKNLKMKSKK